MAGESEEGEGCFSGFFGIFAGPRGRLADAVVVERAKRDKSPAALCLASSFDLPTVLGAEWTSKTRRLTFDPHQPEAASAERFCRLLSPLLQSVRQFSDVDVQKPRL